LLTQFLSLISQIGDHGVGSRVARQRRTSGIDEGYRGWCHHWRLWIGLRCYVGGTEGGTSDTGDLMCRTTGLLFCITLLLGGTFGRGAICQRLRWPLNSRDRLACCLRDTRLLLGGAINWWSCLWQKLTLALGQRRRIN
jgi:hypothetical protein